MRSAKIKRECRNSKAEKTKFSDVRPQIVECSKNLRNVNKCELGQFKEVLDCFLSKVPDEPKADGLTPGATDVISGRATNTLEFQCARRTETWDTSDFNFGQGH